MLNLMFFLKTLAFTVLIVLCLQMRFDNRTLEDHATMFIRASRTVEPLQGVVEGGVRVVRNSINWVSTQVNRQMAKRRQGSRENTSAIEFRRSQAYEKTHSDQSATNRMERDRTEE